MTETVKKVIDELNEYDAKITIEEQPDVVYVTIKDKIYTLYPGYDEQQYDDIVSYIVNDANLQLKENFESDEISIQEDFESETVENQELTKTMNSNPSLLIALDSEKDAKITYSTLIEIEENSDNPNQEVIDLLKTILTDELEHIALLSALQAKQTSDFVSEDEQQNFNDIVSEI